MKTKRERLQPGDLMITAPDSEGWALFRGSEGEDPTLVAFFANREDAVNMAAARDPEDDPLVFDPCVLPALLTRRGIVVGNHYELDTHAALREALKTGRVPEAK